MEKEKQKWYHNNDGKVSLLRILAMVGGMTGVILAIGGLVGFFLKLPDSTSIVMAGVGLVGASGAVKVLQGGQ